jgi:Zn-dependent protease with chaperone function
MFVATLIAAVLLAAGGSSPAEQQSAAYEEKVLVELGRVAPDAVEAGRGAGRAYRERRWQEAFDGYARVLAAAPRFPHALRRQCRARLELGDRAGALPLCRAAVEAAPQAANQMALASALTQRGAGAEPTARDLSSGVALARQAFDADPRDISTAGSACEIALRAQDTALLHRSAERLHELAPGETGAQVCSVFSALVRDEFGAARRYLAAARAGGLEAAAADELGALIDRAEPAWSRYGWTAVWAVGAWLALLALLLAAGAALSASTLRGARRMAADRSAATRAPALRSVYGAVLWLTCAVYYLSLPLVVLLVLAAAYGVWVAFAAIGRIPVKLVLIVAVVLLVSLWAVLKSLWASVVRGRSADPGIPLDVAAHPRFAAALGEAAARVGTRPVDTVFMTPGTDAAVYERGGLARQLAGRTDRCLILGVALLEGMTQGQLKAVLAHEYGHFVNRDTAGGGLALAVRRSVLEMARALASGGAATWYNPAWLFVTQFHKLFLRVSQGASRLQEILADRWAALAYGGRSFAAGLTHAITRSAQFDRHARTTLREVVDGGLALANLYRFVPSQAVDPAGVAAEVEKAMSAEPSPYDSHPRPVDRIAWVGDLPPAQGADSGGDAPAWDLFDDREALERRLTDEVRANVAANNGVTIPAVASGEGGTAPQAPSAA